MLKFFNANQRILENLESILEKENLIKETSLQQ